MIQWDPVQQKAAEEVARKHEITTDSAKSILEFYLRSNMRHVRNYEPVVVVNIGLYYLDPRKSNNKIRNVIRRYREGIVTEEDLRQFLVRYLALHRIATSHMPMTGKKYRLNMQMFGSNWGVLKVKDNEKKQKEDQQTQGEKN